MNSFITGSRAYGTATPESDLDLCVLMDNATLTTLDNAFGFPIKCGKLNIIPCTSELEMMAWRRATDRCVAAYKRERKLSKAEAIAIHEEARREFGVPERELGGSGKPEDVYSPPTWLG